MSIRSWGLVRNAVMITFPTLLAKMKGNIDYALSASDYSASTEETTERAKTASTLSSASSSKCWSTSKIFGDGLVYACLGDCFSGLVQMYSV